MQHEMRRARHRTGTQRSLKISSFQARWAHGSSRSGRNGAGQRSPGETKPGCTRPRSCLAFRMGTPESARTAPDLQSQTRAAPGAAGVDDLAATLGLHAHQETMGTGAAGLGRLIGTFHDVDLVAISVGSYWRPADAIADRCLDGAWHAHGAPSN